MSRDCLYEQLKKFNVIARRYFYPLCSSCDWCFVEPGRLPNAEAAAQQMLCLPLYGSLSSESASIVCDIIIQLGALARTAS